MYNKSKYISMGVMFVIFRCSHSEHTLSLQTYGTLHTTWIAKCVDTHDSPTSEKENIQVKQRAKFSRTTPCIAAYGGVEVKPPPHPPIPLTQIFLLAALLLAPNGEELYGSSARSDVVSKRKIPIPAGNRIPVVQRHHSYTG